MKYYDSWNVTIYGVIVLILLFLTNNGFGQNTPTNPCPDYFQYRFDGIEWFGVIELRSLSLGETIKLNVFLSLREKLPTNYPGSLELLYSREQTLQNIIHNQPIQYKIKFPLPAPLPKLTQIIYNNRVICSGSGEIGPLVTSIKLEHKLYTEFANIQHQNQQQNNPTSYNLFNPFTTHEIQPPFKIPSPFGNSLNMFGNRPQMDRIPASPEITKLPTEPPRNTFSSTNRPLNEICGIVDRRFAAKPLVIGGERIQRGTWPWLAAVYLNLPSSLSFQCGGNLISSKAVITAAHCFYLHNKRYTKDEVTIFLGRHDIRNWNEEGYIIAETNEIHLHPDYSEDLTSFDADLAIVVLKEVVTFTEYIRPICLWSGPVSISYVEGQSGTVVGWGRNEMGELVSFQPRKVETTIVSDSVCLRSNEQFRLLTSNRTFCAGNKDGRGPCSGDSGGGLVMTMFNRWMLRGTVSASLSDPIRNTCNLDEYVIYVDIAKFLDWINLFM